MKKRFEKSKIYGIFLRKGDGTLLGYTENSFSMSWEKTSVRAWRASDGFDNVKRIFEDLKKLHKGEDLFVSRLGSKECPVSIGDRTPMKNQTRSAKFTWRNALFSVIKTNSPELTGPGFSE